MSSKDARTGIDYVDDGKFIRTALLVRDSHVSSVEIACIRDDGKTERLALLNIAVLDDFGHVIVDVIDTEDRFAKKRVLAFSTTERAHVDVPTGGKVMSCDMSMRRS